MKKVLSLSLILILGMTGFAQTKNVPIKTPKLIKHTVDAHRKAAGKEKAVESINFNQVVAAPSTRFGSKESELREFETMLTTYDLQGNGFVANRMVRFADGSVGVTATWDNTGTSGAANRGTGYNIYLAENDDILDQPEKRIEEEKTGWPSYAQWGEDGEIVVAHTTTTPGFLVCYTREHKGEGEWTRHEIPNPSVGVSAQEMTWPRVITSGPNHNIIHVIAADQDADDLAKTYTFYARSTDAENWTVGFMPTLDEDGEEGSFSSDYYALAANGNTVAILLTGDIMAHTYILKSEDNGETWSKIKVWDNPYAGLDWTTDENTLFDEDHPMYGPETGAICIDNNGMVHAVFSSHSYIHAALGTSYTLYSGLTIDGLFYWNENMYPETNGTVVAPVWDYDGDSGHIHVDSDPHNCFRMWWPSDDEHVVRNFDQTLIGFVDPVQAVDWDNDYYFAEEVYYQYFQGCSCLPGICIDEDGTIAIAFSCPDPIRGFQNDANCYYRGVFMSYIDYPYNIGDHYGEWTDEPGDYYYNAEYLVGDFMHMMEECVAVSTIQNTTNHEFWVSYQGDDRQGFFIGNHANQTEPSDNTIWLMKVVPDVEGLSTSEAINPMTAVSVYPNPTVDGNVTFEINASQASEMNIAIYNITGQKVMEQNVNATLGISKQQINVSSLNSGIYFATVKANGFENTVKFVVK